jgi:hypothetical protein
LFQILFQNPFSFDFSLEQKQLFWNIGTFLEQDKLMILFIILKLVPMFQEFLQTNYIMSPFMYIENKCLIFSWNIGTNCICIKK